MGYCIAAIENEFVGFNSDKNEIEQFENKWKQIIELFEGEFFVKKDEQSFCLFSLPGNDFTINTRNFPRLDNGKPNKQRAMSKFFSNVKHSQGDCDFGFGTKGFNDNFYSDLYSLCGGEYEWSVSSVNCGDEGYYIGSFKLLSNGIAESFDFIENEEGDW